MDALLRLWPCAWRQSFSGSRRFADRGFRRFSAWWWSGLQSQGRSLRDDSEALDRIYEQARARRNLF
ncbi:hypothetical protein QU487_11220 [Crenobacter sp. SG2305]|uniref:hypothetical protein n=1 Tax=Crenobacter oryzisoli TaxID=3056844 RepID=UPI0025AB543A|nr:hypothetical protein [Crenobacter sp. SG2305]MDN0083317.1 hypothetical protein [Crenobacter sp. SG2305]